jgi:putative flippase GtrA
VNNITGKLARYLLTGGAAACVDIGGFTLLATVRMPVIVAAACSFVTATVVNFLLTARYVFGATATPQRYTAFLAAALLGLVVNVSLTSVGVIYFALPRAAAKTVAVGVTFLFNFWLNARFVFREQSTQTTSPPPSSNPPHSAP